MSCLKEHIIVLVGMMGCGKTTIGKKLSTIIPMPFIDSDAVIEQRYRMSIQHIFRRHGEDVFRHYERECIIHTILERPASVVALGGGAFIQKAIRDAITRQHAISLWLDVPLPILTQRLARKNAHRPLLHGKNTRHRLRTLYRQRQPFYAQANIRCPCSMEKPDITTRQALDALQHYVQHKEWSCNSTS
ncbi:MAG: shikimate kinase [Alphaproteobacteria bacterium GM7ARS4]|nr:shikimate kinase [Alphaproteobacteria bacterium GM7ARS4]